MCRHGLSAHQLTARRSSEISTDRLLSLSRREVQAFDLLVRGLTTNEVAAALGISARTAEHLRRKVHEKLELKGIVALVRYAARIGWI
ncbi:LuxR C-terminal-related transcriptional regulator [Solimonas terrae]|uniref:LuxR C-terminal-related transcriptional regulator n=1 Tax=Solimonas terrae TaxID=1396819 RepID=UPI001F506803|nr:LuxR C-terminal-related transcriptional regulator [Solimonas terrae]